MSKPMPHEVHKQAVEDRGAAEALVREMQFKEASKFYNELAGIIHAPARNFISHSDISIRIGPVAYEASRTANLEFNRIMRLRKKSVADNAKRGRTQ
jgi:hypothetical protein